MPDSRSRKPCGARKAPIASLALKDTGEEATTVHLARNAFDPAYDEALGELMKTREPRTGEKGRPISTR